MIGLMSPYTLCKDITRGDGKGRTYCIAEADVYVPPLLACGVFSLIVAFTSTGSLPPKSLNCLFNSALTSSGNPASDGTPSAETAVGELRRLSGLTWDQLARIFDVSRRSLHHWASGATLNSANEEKLHRTLATIRRIDRGDSLENRAAILSAAGNGTIPFDLLVSGDFERVIALLGTMSTQPPAPNAIPSSLGEIHLPIRVEDLMDASHQTVHKVLRGGRAAKSMRVRGSGRAG